MKVYEIEICQFSAYVEGESAEDAILGMFCHPRPRVIHAGSFEVDGEGTTQMFFVEPPHGDGKHVLVSVIKVDDDDWED